jgi:hypothetical protein
VLPLAFSVWSVEFIAIELLVRRSVPVSWVDVQYLVTTY